MKQPLVPFTQPDVVEFGARSVGRVGGMQPPAGELEQKEAVDRAEAHLPSFGARIEVRDIGEQPSELRCGKIRIDDEAGGLLHVRAPAFSRKLSAKPRSATVLPDNGIGERPARRPLPNHRGLALVGDTNGSDLLGANSAQHLATDKQHRPPNLLWIVLDLSGSRIELREWDLRRRTRRAFGVEQDGTRACRPLVYGEDVSVAAHQRAEPPVWLAIQPQYSALPPSVGRTSSAGSS